MAGHLNILIVEHEAAAARTLSAACAEKGWTATLADGVVPALVAARKSVPDAVVVDAGLPSGGALITVKRLRAAVDTATTPVVLVGREGPVEALLAAGASAHVPDPADAAALQAALEGPAAVSPPAEAPAEILQHPVRLAALQASGLLDTAPEGSFDRLTRLVARLLGVPTALLSLVDKDRQLFKSMVGLPEPWASARQTPLSHSFCQWVVSGRDTVRVSDAREHKVLRNNAALRDLGVVAYAGVPVISVQGEALGSLCAIEGRPREWTPDDEATLNDLARVAEACIAHAMLVRQPPQAAQDLDHYVEAAGGAVTGAVDILRRHGARLAGEEREVLLGLIEEHAAHLVQMNRLIQVNQTLR